MTTREDFLDGYGYGDGRAHSPPWGLYGNLNEVVQ